MPWKSRVVQPVTKASAEQELPHQQLWFGVLSFYRRHATMPLFFRQFVHKGLFTNSYISAQRFAKLKFFSCGGVNMSEKMISRF